MSKTEFIDLSTELRQIITTDQAWHYHIIPKAHDNNQLEFYVDERAITQSLQDELEMLFGRKVSLEKSSGQVVEQTLSRHYQKDKGKTANQKITAYSGSRENFLGMLIEEAERLQSSDIHIESYEERCRIRYRIDGRLIERYTIPVRPREKYDELINQIKVKANLDIAEKRLPQDGRIFYSGAESKFDIRVSVLPTLHREKIVLRLLNRDITGVDIKSLGMLPVQLDVYLEGVKKPHGIVLISGPTGSGKTTTLYATLKKLNREGTNILTIEDPIEYTLEGVNQVQLKESIGLTFSSALRTFLRQDPDIIMLGEIRDDETAKMAIRAALTGHLVLSTIHTNSAWDTVNRLKDMGIPSYLLASTLNTTVAQRLLRLLCTKCKEEQPVNKNLYPPGFNPFKELSSHFIGKGCSECYYTGYRGRVAVFEIIPVDTEINKKIKDEELNIDDLLKKRKIKSLKETAFELLQDGTTSLEEVYPILAIG